MGDPVTAPKVIRFGAYEVDLRSTELRKSGLRVKLTGQPFQILAILLEHPGELVTREELQKRLWPGDTFVDFDRGLNATINRVREALGDSAENPRFVETLPRRGYRFIGPVEGIGRVNSTESKSSGTGQRNRTVGRGWKIGIAAGSVILLITLFSPAARHRLIALFRPPSQPQPLEAVPLTTLPGRELFPSFSPDGSQVAFAWDGENNGAGFDLYVKVIGTDKPLRLTNHPAEWLGTAWSPDGRYIAVHRLGGKDPGIFLIPPLGGPERKLTTSVVTFAPAAAISWSSDGKQLAFVDVPPGSGMQLYLLPLDTLARKSLETGCARVVGPRFSPNADLLAYTCIEDFEVESLNLIWLTEGKTQRFSFGPGSFGPSDIGEISWSSDGKRIVFSGGGELWEFDPSRTNHPEKMSIGHDAHSPVINAGGRLAYVQSWDNASIWRIDLKSGKADAHKLVASTRHQVGPNFSPDGSKIVFASDRSGAREIWICDSDGENAVQLTSLGSTNTGTARWSPDGKQIAFDSRAGGEANVYLMDAGGGVPRRLETGTRMNSMPSWSHDGRWIYFVSDSASPTPTIWRVAAAGGQAVQLTKAAAVMPIESPDGGYVYFNNLGDEMRLWRVRPDGTEERLVEGMPALHGVDVWWPFQSGIYFIADVGTRQEIDFLDLRTSRIQRVYTLEKPAEPWIGGVAVSPDGKWLLYSQIDESFSDLMLVENFH